MDSYVYILKFSNGKLYVGVSYDPQKRMAHHIKNTPLIRRATRKYGQPHQLIVAKGNRQWCFETEQYLTDLFGTVVPGGYNLQRGGEGGSIPSDLTRRRISEGKKGSRHSTETRAKMREAHSHRSPISEETRKRISESAKRRGVPVSTIQKLQEGRLRRQTKGISQETRNKLSIAAKRQWDHWRAERSHKSA